MVNLRADADIYLGIPVPISKPPDSGLGELEVVWEPSRDAANWVQKTFPGCRGQRKDLG